MSHEGSGDTENLLVSRQSSIFPPERMSGMSVAIAGCGAVGRQVALQLSSAGIGQLYLFDHDTIGVENLYPQGWRPADLGRSKVESLVDEIGDRSPDCRAEAFYTRFPLAGLGNLLSMREGSNPLPEALFLCVDTIASRSRLFEAYRDTVPVLFDSRVASEVVRVISACDDQSKAYYSETLFSGSEAFRGPCTARMTIHMANIAAGLLIQQFTKWLREMPVDHDVLFNLLSMELIRMV